ncbi:MAG: sodium:solute symporter family protein [Oscillospiraceae bacterium]|jgi:SSS family solute:Na+ symporter/sodium/proline symporter|nr:sodium:solute symporter family protein [Oscillospiraceae bacterium]
MTATWITIGIYIAVLVAIGIVTGRSSKSVADITVGGRRAGAWLSSLSYGTAYFSAVMFVGYAGSTGFGFGLWGVLAGLGNAVFGALLAWLLLAQRTQVLAKGWNLHTMPEFLGKRYDSRAMKLFSCLVIFVFLVPYSASVYKGLGSIAQVLLGINDTAFMVIIAALAALLLLFGGYLVQARADFVQGIIMVVGVVLLIFFVVRSSAVGGAQGIAEYARAHAELGLTPKDGKSWWALLSLVLMTSFGTWGLPHMIQKFFGIRDKQAARRGITISTLFALLVAGGGYFIGSLCHLFIKAGAVNLAGLQEAFPKTFKDFIVPSMLQAANIPDVLMGVVIVLLLAASVSTLCSVTLTAGSTLVKDFVGTVRPGTKEKSISRGIKLVCVLFVGMSYFVANSSTPILDLMSYSWGIISGSFLAPYVISLYYKGTNKVGAWGGIFTGFGIAIVPAANKIISLFYAPGAIPETVDALSRQGTQYAVVAMACSVAVCFLLSALTRKAVKPVEAPAEA